MWWRIKRLFRGIFGWMIEKAEDPEMILKQVIRDMNDKIPQMRENVVQVMSTERQFARDMERLNREITDLDVKVKAAVRQGKDDVAKLYITQMQDRQLNLEKSKAQHESAKIASDQAKKLLDNYILQVKRKTAEAMTLAGQARAAKMQEQLSQAMSSFQVGDDSSTFDEMRERIQRRAAAAEARMDLATGGIEGKIQEVERESMDLQVEDTLAAYKQQMGIVEPPSVATAPPEESTMQYPPLRVVEK